MTRKLIAIGGAENVEGDSEILQHFVRLAHGEKARIVIMPVATRHANEVIPKYRKVFRKAGATEIAVFDINQREDTASETGLNLIKNATGIFFPGGDQLNITSLLGGTSAAALLKKKFDAGTVIGGTSAGAAMMSSSMLLSGKAEENPRFGNVEIGPGMDFMGPAIIDTHFSQRGRCGRLMTAVAHYPQTIGLGIDENTALVLRDDEFEVLGSGAVIVIDGGSMTHSNLSDLEHGDPLELHNLTIHILPKGAHYDLARRRPLAQSRRELALSR
jgi:cyanophycinase